MFFCLLKNDDGTFSTYERKRTTPLLEVSILNCYFVSWTNKLCNLHVRVESNIEFEPFLITSLKRLKLEDYYSLSRPHIYLLDLSINKTAHSQLIVYTNYLLGQTNINCKMKFGFQGCAWVCIFCNFFRNYPNVILNKKFMPDCANLEFLGNRFSTLQRALSTLLLTIRKK